MRVLLSFASYALSLAAFAAPRPSLREQDDKSQELRVCAHNYAPVAAGQVFVAQSWLSNELLQALRTDLSELLRDGSLTDSDEPIGKRLKVELYTHRWTAPGEKEPSAARAAARRLFDKLRIELELVLGRRLIIDQMGAQAKYSISKVGEPVTHSCQTPPT